ncbi:hypothetical protein EV182_007784 [Spiromyces aspiralis]|uniref:Uncharacterized protein n=1 Tax=Spiromyces aspiralis TaxID=68401 RepID=A0ACC1H7E3_9FUNG|nr:hypothetical protein EV182_007784 [Spiromyces aspiralis]
MPASARDSVATLSLGNSRTIATVNLLGTTRTPLPRSMYSPPTTDDDWSKQTAKGDCSPTSASKKPTCCNRPISPSTSTSTTATTDVGDGSPTTATASPALSCVSASNDVDKAMVQLQDLVLANGAELEDRDAAQLNQLSLLLRCIRFPQMDKIYLLNHIEPLAKKFEPSVMKSLLIEAYRHHAFNNDPLLKERGLTHVVLALGDHDPLALARSQPRRPFPYRDFQQILST